MAIKTVLNKCSSTHTPKPAQIIRQPKQIERYHKNVVVAINKVMVKMAERLAKCTRFSFSYHFVVFIFYFMCSFHRRNQVFFSFMMARGDERNQTWVQQTPFFILAIYNAVAFLWYLCDKMKIFISVHLVICIKNLLRELWASHSTMNCRRFHATQKKDR